MQKTIPDKLYFKIGEVAKIAEVPTHVIRYWESEFPSIKPKRANSKQRLFRKQDIELILKIKTLLHHQGYTISGARKVLSRNEDPKNTVTVEDKTTPDLSRKLQELKKGLKQIQNILFLKKD